MSIVAWPNPNDYCKGTTSAFEESQQELAYERARADAAMVALRIAEKALRNVSAQARSGYYDGPGLERFVEIRGLAEEALAAIGELPKSELWSK